MDIRYIGNKGRIGIEIARSASQRQCLCGTPRQFRLTIQLIPVGRLDLAKWFLEQRFERGLGDVAGVGHDG